MLDEELALGLRQVLGEDGTSFAGADPFLDQDLLLRMYREMSRIRLIDELMLGKQRQGKVGFYGTITGQEATPIATALALNPEDWVFPALREAAVMLVRGFPLTTWLAQVYGNAMDLQKGRQMPSHQAGRAVNQVGWSSCIGPQITQAVGAAMAAKLKGDGIVSVGFMGDGATSQPDFHAAMTFASKYQAPVVLICQNNHWSISVPTAKQTVSKTIAIKSHAYGIQGVRVDGNDVIATYEVIREAVSKARRGQGPTFIECLTYRMGPHSSSDDPTRYRDSAEVEMWGRRDPIKRIEIYLRRAGIIDDTSIDAMKVELEHEFRQAAAIVEEQGNPARETMFEDIYETLPWHLREQQAEYLALPPAPTGHGGSH